MMNSQQLISNINAQSGISLAEYAMLIGLIAVLSIFSLQSLGGSTHDLLADSGTKLETQGTLSLLKTPAAANGGMSRKSVGALGNSPYKLVTNPTTGKISFQVAGGLQGVATNTTSLDGSQLNTLGTAMIANKLTQLAEAETDPALKDYYGKLARASFYLGAAEGQLDNVSGLALSNSKYTSADALRDVINLSQEMGSLLGSVPTGMDADSIREVIPLATEVYNIAQGYKNGLSDYIAEDGMTTKEFETTTSNNGGFIQQLFDFFTGQDSSSITTAIATTGTGEPGSVLETLRSTSPGDLQKEYTPYSSLVTYEQLKNTSEQILAENKVASVPVESTLVNATVIDEAATLNPKP